VSLDLAAGTGKLSRALLDAGLDVVAVEPLDSLRAVLAVLSVVPDWSGATWAHELGTLVQTMRLEHPHFDGPPWQEAVRADGGWTALREIRVTTSQPARPERIVDHIGSMSWIAAMPDVERVQALSRMRAIIDAGDTPAELPIHVGRKHMPDGVGLRQRDQRPRGRIVEQFAGAITIGARVPRTEPRRRRGRTGSRRSGAALSRPDPWCEPAGRGARSVSHGRRRRRR
jgi:hypothetical protein